MALENGSDMTDREIVAGLIANDTRVIQEFFFVRCRSALSYIGQYFCHDKFTPEELIGEFYEFLAGDDWRKLRIFRYTCSLNSYIMIIASRYFQHKREKELLPLDDNIAVVKELYEDNYGNSFLIEDLHEVMSKLQPFDRFLIQRILIDGEKPGDILDEAKSFIDKDRTLNTEAQNRAQLAGYVYTRYNRVKKNLQKQMIVLGYGQ